MRVSAIAVLGCLILGSLSGCGGGSGGGPVAQTAAAPPSVSIEWAARSRAIQAPSSALSAIITFVGAGFTGANITLTVDRNDSPEGYTQSYTSTSAAKSGQCTLSVQFFAQKGGTGALVASATTPVLLKSDGSLAAPSGGDLGTIAATGKVASVEVTAGQSVLVGETKDLTFTAKDANGAILAVTPGSVFFVAANGPDLLDIVKGQAVGVAIGTAHVTAAIDGVTSASQAVAVTTNIAIDVQPSTPTLSVGDSVTFTATVTNSTHTGVVWSVQEGATGGSVTANGAYTAPSTPGVYRVVATSQYDPSKQTTVPVTVIAGNSQVVIQ